MVKNNTVCFAFVSCDYGNRWIGEGGGGLLMHDDMATDTWEDVKRTIFYFIRY